MKMTKGKKEQIIEKLPLSREDTQDIIDKGDEFYSMQTVDILDGTVILKIPFRELSYLGEASKQVSEANNRVVERIKEEKGNDDDDYRNLVMKGIYLGIAQGRILEAIRDYVESMPTED